MCFLGLAAGACRRELGALGATGSTGRRGAHPTSSPSAGSCPRRATPGTVKIPGPTSRECPKRAWRAATGPGAGISARSAAPSSVTPKFPRRHPKRLGCQPQKKGRPQNGTNPPQNTNGTGKRGEKRAPTQNRQPQMGTRRRWRAGYGVRGGATGCHPPVPVRGPRCPRGILKFLGWGEPSPCPRVPVPAALGTFPGPRRAPAGLH